MIKLGNSFLTDLAIMGNFLTDLAIKFPTKKKDQNQRYKFFCVGSVCSVDIDNFINYNIISDLHRKCQLLQIVQDSCDTLSVDLFPASGSITQTYCLQYVCQCLLRVSKAGMISSRSYSYHDVICNYMQDIS
jgi:hypothetical protein